MTPEGCAVPTIAEIEQRVEELSRALSAGRRPSSEEADRLRIDVSRLARSGEGVAPWRTAQLHADVQEVVRHALPPAPRPVEIPVQRGARRRTRQRRSPIAEVVEVIEVAPPMPRPSHRIDLEALFNALRNKVDALHDAVEAGQRPTRAEFDLLHDGLAAFRRRSDGPEIRQMLDDVRLLHRIVLAEARRSSAGLSVTDGGRRSRGRFTSRSSSRRRRFETSRATRTTQQTAPEDERLVEEAWRLRERADKFAAAKSAGRVLPLRESDRLFLHFRILRPQLDADVRALNDAAVRRLADAVVEARARQDH